ncbi:MAG: hypothetical protein JWR10_599, partial [Rubritepida sp.]|nr:hypothetical protein [Rubritepida sp.]
CFGGVDFDNVMFSPVNRGIYCRNSGRMDFHRIRGQVFTAGIEIDEAFDTCRMMNLHFWPFWSANDNVVRWQQANGDALIFRRCDGVFVDQAFVLGYRSMFHFSSSAAGYTQKFSIGQAYADFVRHGIWIDADGTDGQIDAMTVQCEIFNAAGAPVAGSIGIYVNASNSKVQIGSLRIDDAQDNAIRLEQHSNRLDIGALRVLNYNLRNNGAAAIHLANAVTGIANRVNLASPPLLETAIPGPLFNSGTNGSAGLQGPAGEAARPGLAIGQPDTGLYRPVTGGLAAAANGVELLRATGGTLSLGAEPGSHALEVTTPPSAVNRVEMRGGVTGAPGLVGWLAAGADANISAVIGQPKGAGAVTAQFADGAIAGGIARGANATDFQIARSSATQVASGPNSTIAGGQSNTASNSNTVVAGGSLNVSSGNTSAIGGGANNVASATTSTVSGGAANTADGGNAWIPGGRNATTRGLVGRAAWASGAFTIQGDAQSGEHLLRRVTTDATATRLTGDSLAQASNNTVNLPNSGTYMLRLLVVAQQTGGTAGTAGDCAGWELTALVKRGASAAATVLVGGSGSSVAPLHASAAAATWRLGLAADTTAGGLALTATGEANKTVRWVARILSVETTA